MDRNHFLKGRYDNELDQLILGSILGDGMLEIPKEKAGNRGNCFLRIRHSEQQLPYLQWKKDLLVKHGLTAADTKLVREVTRIKKYNKSYVSYVLCSRRSPRFSWWETEAYESAANGKRRKKVTRRLLNRLEPLGLAIWYMDDGHLAFNPKGNGKGGSFQIILSTECFTEEENLKIQRYFDVMWDIHFRLMSAGKMNGHGKHLVANMTEGSKFLGIVKPYIHPTLAYKVDFDGQKQRALNRWKIKHETQRQPSLWDEEIVGPSVITPPSLTDEAEELRRNDVAAGKSLL